MKRLESASHVQDSQGDPETVFIGRVVEGFGEDGSGPAEKNLIAIGSGAVNLGAGIGKHPTVIVVEGFPSPEGFAVDGEPLCDLDIVVPLQGKFDGTELEFGELIGLGNVPLCPRMSQIPGGAGGACIGVEGLEGVGI
jgi:hypothetical protein